MHPAWIQFGLVFMAGHGFSTAGHVRTGRVIMISSRRRLPKYLDSRPPLRARLSSQQVVSLSATVSQSVTLSPTSPSKSHFMQRFLAMPPRTGPVNDNHHRHNNLPLIIALASFHWL